MLNNERGEGALTAVILLFLAIMIGLGIWVNTLRYHNQQTVRITVSDKERVVDQDGGSARYLIYTPNETFENTDALWVGKFNSGDVYGQLERGKQYDCLVMGYRFQYFSTYRDIVKCTAVEESK